MFESEHYRRGVHGSHAAPVGVLWFFSFGEFSDSRRKRFLQTDSYKERGAFLLFCFAGRQGAWIMSRYGLHRLQGT